MKKLYILTFSVVVAALPMMGMANTLISGNLATGSNWDTGLPNTAGNIGVVDADNVFPNQGALTTATGLYIQQTGGAVTGGGIKQTLDSTSYEMTGGNLNLQTLNVNNGSTLTIDGGTVSMGSGRDLILRSSTLTISSGIMDVTDQMFGASSGSKSDTFFNFSGGTFTVAKLANGFNNVGTYNFSGTASVTAGSTGTGSDRVFNFGLGTGSLDITGDMDTDNMALDWLSGSGFSLTAGTIDGSSSYETLWNAGKLTVDGGQTGTFAENFNVSGSTLTVIPEPATMGLLVSCGALLLMGRRLVM